MADLKDEKGNPMILTDQHGKPAQLMDEYGNAMHLTGVATTVPHLKESSYTGPHPITAPITTTDTPHHAQPLSVSHLSPDPLKEHSFEDINDQGGRKETNIMDKSKMELGGNEPMVATTTGSVHEPHEKKGLTNKIKEKLCGHVVKF